MGTVLGYSLRNNQTRSTSRNSNEVVIAGRNNIVHQNPIKTKNKETVTGKGGYPVHRK